jgi:DNA-binding MarR family transcriptional regulator
MPPSHSDFDAALLDVEQQLGLLWRRGRSASLTLSRALHPDLDPAAYGLLSILFREGPLRITDLAATVGVGKPTVSRQIALLTDLGLVRKEADPHDGRAHNVTLTETGTEHVASLRDRRHEFFRGRLAEWSQEDVRALASYLVRLNEALAPQ